ncbi:UNVERIFIED_ORG: TolB-like protein [Martelella mediterranea]
MERQASFSDSAMDMFCPDDVRAELSRILASTSFRATRLRRQMLSFVIEETLAGRASELKGYTIGVHVFGRPTDFDPGADPVVRLEARRLRNDLGVYYAEAGRNNKLRITIPIGGYVPVMTRQQPLAQGEPEDRPPVAEPDDNAAAIRFPARVKAMAVGAALILTFAAAGLWTILGREEREPSVVKPSLVILPLKVLSDSDEDRSLALSIVSRIVGDLGRFPGLSLYDPRQGISQEPGADPAYLGRQWGVSYVLAGEFWTRGNIVTVVTRLVESDTGRVVWTGYHDRDLSSEDLSALEREISSNLASALAQPFGVIRADLARALSDSPGPNSENYECVLRGYYFRRTYEPKLHAPIMSCLEEAVERDPSDAEAWAMLGFMHFASSAMSIIPDYPGVTLDSAAEHALHSLDIDPENILGLKTLSVVQHLRENYADAERLARLAAALNPNDPDALYQLGWRLAIRGNFAEGVPLIEAAIEQTVSPPGPYYHLLAIDRLMKGDGEGMLAFATRASVDGSALSQSLVAMAENLLGHREEAQRAIARMNEITPHYEAIARFRAYKATDEIIAAMTAALEGKS